MIQKLQHKVRIVTAASLFDGHDAAINIMRRIMQAKGAEVIHLGHNRSVREIVEAAIEEDVQGIAITSYQGGHMEFFKYMKDLLDENECGHIKIFGGGGGTILPEEIRALHSYGIAKIYSPDDGRIMGLEGMIAEVLQQCDVATPDKRRFIKPVSWGEAKDVRLIASQITAVENGQPTDVTPHNGQVAVIGITGTGGAGKSSVTDEIVRRFLNSFADKTVAVISVDPSKKKSGGALLGDRIRMNAVSHSRVYMRSLATRDDNMALSKSVKPVLDICKAAGFDLILLETAGVGQSDTSVMDYCDVGLYVMTPEYGAASQLEKINMLDYADVICINKFDKAGALDALDAVRRQYMRNHGLWTTKPEELPVIGTIAAQFNDSGINELFEQLMIAVEKKTGLHFGDISISGHLKDTHSKSEIIPPKRVRYLSEIADAVRGYNNWAEEQSELASKLYRLRGAMDMMKDV